MNKKLTIGLMAAVGIAAGGVTALLDGPTESIRAAKEYRLAVIGSACADSMESCDHTYSIDADLCMRMTDQVMESCDHTYSIDADLCMCMTDQVAAQPGEVVDIDTLPSAKHFKFLVCEYKGDPPEDKPKRFAGWFGLAAGPDPVAVRCVTIHGDGVKEKSVKNARGSLLTSLENKCCEDCAGACFVEPGAWGMCPYCKLDETCADYCP